MKQREIEESLVLKVIDEPSLTRAYLRTDRPAVEFVCKKEKISVVCSIDFEKQITTVITCFRFNKNGHSAKISKKKKDFLKDNREYFKRLKKQNAYQKRGKI